MADVDVSRKRFRHKFQTVKSLCPKEGETYVSGNHALFSVRSNLRCHLLRVEGFSYTEQRKIASGQRRMREG